jgi:hypothetical protein
MYNKITEKIIDRKDTSILTGILLRASCYYEYSFNIKFKLFTDNIANPFMSNADVMDYQYTFCKIQQIYFAFLKFIRITKLRYSKIVVDNDMCLNPINIKDKNTIVILQENKKYLFTAGDLISIINNSLTHNYFFISTPHMVKNPYNNMAFDKSTLYNIYFFIRFNMQIEVELLYNYFRCNFNLKIMLYKNEYLLREYAINDYIYKSDTETLSEDILAMITYMNYSCRVRIRINKDFPKKTLVHIMRPYLNLYMNMSYSLVQTKREDSYFLLHDKYKKFFKFNPGFGRKLVTCQCNYNGNSRRIVYTFNDRSPRFNNGTTESYLTSHLSI